jgi:hypothetical protein
MKKSAPRPLEFPSINQGMCVEVDPSMHRGFPHFFLSYFIQLPLAHHHPKSELNSLSCQPHSPSCSRPTCNLAASHLCCGCSVFILGLDLFSSLSSSSMRVCILLRKRQRCTDLLKNQTMVDSFRRRLYAMRRTLRVASFSPIAFLD